MNRTPIVAVLCLTSGLAQGTLYGSQPSSAGAAILNSTTKPCSHPQSKALLTLSSRGDVSSQNAPFTGRGPFVISWSTHRANPGRTDVAFHLHVYDSNNSDVYTLHNYDPGTGSYILRSDCAGGCTLYVDSTNLAYTVTVSR